MSARNHDRLEAEALGELRSGAAQRPVVLSEDVGRGDSGEVGRDLGVQGLEHVSAGLRHEEVEHEPLQALGLVLHQHLCEELERQRQRAVGRGRGTGPGELGARRGELAVHRDARGGHGRVVVHDLADPVGDPVGRAGGRIAAPAVADQRDVGEIALFDRRMSPSLQEVGLAVKRLQWRHHRAANTRLAAVGLSLAQWDVLRHLHADPYASLHGLAVLTFQTDQSMGALAARMVERGIIQRAGGPGRAVRHRVTEQGERARRAGSDVMDSVLHESFAHLSDDQLAELHRLLIVAGGTHKEDRPGPEPAAAWRTARTGFET